MGGKDPVTPMMRQYQEIKAQHPDEILFFRLGDFYEMFDDDAIEVSRLLNLTLTHRGSAPMCGIPYHAATSYLKRLLDAGHKVAVCEQLTLPESSRELARREVVQVYTPGTVVEDEYLDSFKDNYVFCVDVFKGQCVTAFADLSSGSFFARDLGKDPDFSSLVSLLSTISIAEIIVSDDLYFTDRGLRSVLDAQEKIVTKLPSWSFSLKEGRNRIKKIMNIESLASFGLDDKSPLLSPIGALLGYLVQMSRSDLRQIDNIRVLDDCGRLLLDEATTRNLEIVKALNGGSAYTLFSAIDRTCTAAGSRRLKEILLQPLCDRLLIEERLSWTGRLVDDVDERMRIRGLLSSCADLIRLASKLEMKRSVVRDLTAIKESLYSFFSLVGERDEYLRLLGEELGSPDSLLELAGTIAKAINPECTNDRDSGGIVLQGYDEELDRLREIHAHGSSLLEEYLDRIRKETGITIMKCGENRIIGTYLEVSKSQLSKVPDYFIRRQTLVGGERFSTPELSALEEKIASSQAEADERERSIYNSIVASATALAGDLRSIGVLFAQLDVYQSFAQISASEGYVRPVIQEEGELTITGGRHPVVEQYLDKGSFVCNGFDSTRSRFALITGPNMAGKSTYLRQNALIVLMAHCGCFVPATSAVIPLVDRIFCRVGASDNLAKGESTFLVEMQEASFILRNATRRSFVIMDEIGRGTSTQDGMSIAYAIMMYLLRMGCITLFATHYHELTMMDTSQMQLLTLEVAQQKNDIVFLRRVMDGIAESSYGLHVARMAGIPTSVIREASAFQKRHFADYSMDLSTDQLDLFVDTSAAGEQDKDRILDEIIDFDLTSSTPLEAMVKIGRLQEEIRALSGNE